MTRDYFSDREGGPRSRTKQEVDSNLWAAVLTLLERGIDGGTFALDFPIRCRDGARVYACDRDGLMATIRAEIPELTGMLRVDAAPPTLAVLDLLEFMHRHAWAAAEGKYHGLFDHHHLRFDREEGQEALRASANRLLARSGMVYELDENGRVVRLAPSALAADLRKELPPTRDDEFDQLLEVATKKFLDPDPLLRKEGLERLWDAFVRAKTVLNSDKQKGVRQLIAAATRGTSQYEAEVLADEMRSLTQIGNTFRIRHHETSAIEPSVGQVDYLFARMHACILRVHSALR